MHKTYLKLAAVTGALSVALGAFGAHALKEKLPADALAIYETAIRYQFYHVFALLATGILYKDFSNKWIHNAGKLFILGTILFSGSLYLLTAFKGMGNENMNWIGAITPLGGLSFILGWLFLVMGISKK
ncbi:MAG: DUF423 domain-containing protein [Sphingobacteriales bacterium]|nr:MAG: DUF423 domain-containing protein [Sphingobacteriales bacterium]